MKESKTRKLGIHNKKENQKEGKVPQGKEHVLTVYTNSTLTIYINVSVFYNKPAESALVAQGLEQPPEERWSSQTSGFETFSENPGEGACTNLLFLFKNEILTLKSLESKEKCR